MIERSINFDRLRHMRCGSCQHEWAVTSEWLERFDQVQEGCPACGTDCRSEDRPDFWADPGDPLHNDDAAPAFYWYHASTHAAWPDLNFDPTAALTELTKQRMESMGASVDHWAERQNAKALHIGTYEAAIENVFRRLRDQGGAAEDFHLYRVRLDPDCVIEPGVHREPTDFVGDAYLDQVCAPGTTVMRYVNVHEDASSVSLAIRPVAVQAVQRIELPLLVDPTDPWIRTATQRLVAAAALPQSESGSDDPKVRLPRSSELSREIRRLESEVAEQLPTHMRQRFTTTGLGAEAAAADPCAFSKKLVGLVRLVTNPQASLDALDVEPWRIVNSP